MPQYTALRLASPPSLMMLPGREAAQEQKKNNAIVIFFPLERNLDFFLTRISPHINTPLSTVHFAVTHVRPFNCSNFNLNCLILRTDLRLLKLLWAFQKKIHPSEWEGALLTSDVLRGTPSLSVSLTCPWQRRSFTAQITKWPLQFPF